MRSSIACIRCRRSKVKCVNTGVGTTCRNCENAGRECRYPSPILVAGQKRRDSIPPRLDGGNEEGRRQRPRKNTQSLGPPPGASDQPRAQQDPLDARILTPEVWQKLFEIWQMHYSIDLPFIHPLTFLRPIRAAESAHFGSLTAVPGVAMARPPGRPGFLLAFLALTARFHPVLAAHHFSPNGSNRSNAILASDYYATAAKAQLARQSDDEDRQDMEMVQTLLMLGLHEWGMCRGLRAYLTVGNAVRLAQALGLHYEEDLDDRPWSCNSALSRPAAAHFSNDDSTSQELRRRTLWSCFNMEGHLCRTKYRTQSLGVPSIRIQLPASERAFVSGEKVWTSMIDEPHDLRKSRKIRQDRLEILNNGRSHQAQLMHQNAADQEDSGVNDLRVETALDQDLLNRYIQILDIYADIAQWGCDGGHKTDIQPPWHADSRFFANQKLLILFDKQLRRPHELTIQNTQAYISLKTSTPYALVHFVRLLCRMNMDREFLPFVPLQCTEPQVPLDPPYSYRNTEGAHRFWKGNAMEYFRAAREVTELARSCQEWGVLVATPIAGFAIYSAALAGVYAVNFPWMDQGGSMCTPLPPAKAELTRSGDSRGLEAARQAFQLVASLSTRLRMADGWLKTLINTHKYCRRFSAEYKQIDLAAAAPKDHIRLADALNGHDFAMLEKTMKDFGGFDDEDVQMADTAPRTNTSTQDDMEDISSALDSDKSGDEENGDDPNELRHQASNESGGAWNAVNSNSAATSRHGSVSAPNSSGFRAYDPYPLASRDDSAQPSTSVTPMNRTSGQPNYPHQITNLPAPTSSARSDIMPPPQIQSNTSTSSRDVNPSWTPTTDPKPALVGGTTQANGHRSSSDAAVNNTPSTQSQRPQPQAATAPSASWTTAQKQEWLDSLVTRFGADDIAAFVEGVDFATWARKAKATAPTGVGGGWLAAVWS